MHAGNLYCIFLFGLRGWEPGNKNRGGCCFWLDCGHKRGNGKGFVGGWLARK